MVNNKSNITSSPNLTKSLGLREDVARSDISKGYSASADLVFSALDKSNYSSIYMQNLTDYSGKHIVALPTVSNIFNPKPSTINASFDVNKNQIATTFTAVYEGKHVKQTSIFNKQKDGSLKLYKTVPHSFDAPILEPVKYHRSGISD